MVRCMCKTFLRCRCMVFKIIFCKTLAFLSEVLIPKFREAQLKFHIHVISQVHFHHILGACIIHIKYVLYLDLIWRWFQLALLNMHPNIGMTCEFLGWSGYGCGGKCSDIHIYLLCGRPIIDSEMGPWVFQPDFRDIAPATST